jgi:hypothetical protein
MAGFRVVKRLSESKRMNRAASSVVEAVFRRTFEKPHEEKRADSSYIGRLASQAAVALLASVFSNEEDRKKEADEDATQGREGLGKNEIPKRSDLRFVRQHAGMAAVIAASAVFATFLWAFGIKEVLQLFVHLDPVVWSKAFTFAALVTFGDQVGFRISDAPRHNLSQSLLRGVAVFVSGFLLGLNARAMIEGISYFVPKTGVWSFANLLRSIFIYVGGAVLVSSFYSLLIPGYFAKKVARENYPEKVEEVNEKYTFERQVIKTWSGVLNRWPIILANYWYMNLLPWGWLTAELGFGAVSCVLNIYVSFKSASRGTDESFVESVGRLYRSAFHLLMDFGEKMHLIRTKIRRMSTSDEDAYATLLTTIFPANDYLAYLVLNLNFSRYFPALHMAFEHLDEKEKLLKIFEPVETEIQKAPEIYYGLESRKIGSRQILEKYLDLAIVVEQILNKLAVALAESKIDPTEIKPHIDHARAFIGLIRMLLSEDVKGEGVDLNSSVEQALKVVFNLYFSDTGFAYAFEKNLNLALPKLSVSKSKLMICLLALLMPFQYEDQNKLFKISTTLDKSSREIILRLTLKTPSRIFQGKDYAVAKMVSQIMAGGLRARIEWQEEEPNFLRGFTFRIPVANPRAELRAGQEAEVRGEVPDLMARVFERGQAALVPKKVVFGSDGPERDFNHRNVGFNIRHSAFDSVQSVSHIFHPLAKYAELAMNVLEYYLKLAFAGIISASSYFINHINPLFAGNVIYTLPIKLSSSLSDKLGKVNENMQYNQKSSLRGLTAQRAGVSKFAIQLGEIRPDESHRIFGGQSQNLSQRLPRSERLLAPSLAMTQRAELLRDTLDFFAQEEQAQKARLKSSRKRSEMRDPVLSQSHGPFLRRKGQGIVLDGKILV